MRHKLGEALFLALVAFIGLGPIAVAEAPAARAADEPALRPDVSRSSRGSGRTGGR